MKRKLIALVLILGLTASLFSGCSAAAPSGSGLSSGRIKPLNMDLSNPADVGLSSFDSMLIEFLKQTGKAKESFVVSPLSLKAALALCVSGTQDEIRDKLLSAMGFASQEQMNTWFADASSCVERFDTYSRGPIAESTGAAYQILNSVWKNTSLPGEFTDSYRQLVEQTYGAEVRSESADKLADAINSWVNEKTNGLIPKIVEFAADSPMIMVNAIYLKDAWADEFRASAQTEFTTVDGTVVEKPFMEREGKYRYYEDDDCQIVSVPLSGGMSMVFVLGNDEGFSEKLNKLENRLVRVVLPKFDVDSSYDGGELETFLATIGCESIFSGEANFTSMFTTPVYVDGIVQKAKVRIDENGLEAAAATAIITKNVGSILTPEDPVLFQADRPFSFYVLDSDADPNVLFWGQIMK